MRQVLIVAPYFPPSNLTAGQRSRYFAMHLPKFGWKVKVLTVRPQFYEEKLDSELEKLLPAGLEIIRTKAFSTRPLRLVGDISIRAFRWHYQAICNLARKKKIDLIYIPVPPNYSALLGPLIYHKFGIPYAIDYIDPWVHPWPGCQRPFSKAWFSYQLGRILEPFVLKNVSLVTAVAPGYYAGVLKRYPWVSAAKCLAIPYGAEESDFRYLDKNPRKPYFFNPEDGSFHFVYAGTLLPKAYSVLESLFEGVGLFKESYPLIAKKLNFYFIGTANAQSCAVNFKIKDLAEKYNISDIVFEYPQRIAYLDVLNHLKYASAILILGSTEAHYTPSKVFQAILACRPILALLHEKSTAAEILRQAGTGKIFTFNGEIKARLYAQGIAKAIYQIVTEEYSAGEINWQAFQVYSAQSITGKLSSAFDSILQKS